MKANYVGGNLKGRANIGKSYVRNSKSNQNIVWIPIFNICVYAVIYEMIMKLHSEVLMDNHFWKS